MPMRRGGGAATPPPTSRAGDKNMPTSSDFRERASAEGDRERIAEARARLERAVQDLAEAAGDRAADYVERATARLRREDARRERWRRREPAWLWSDEPRTAKLYRDAKRGKICGVCGGIARYYGLETWIVRILAVTGLIFLNWVVFVAYLVAALILDREPELDERASERASGRRRGRGRARFRERPRASSPHRLLRDVGAHFDEMELRLRRMEAHVTSDNYELRRELAKIDKPQAPRTN